MTLTTVNILLIIYVLGILGNIFSMYAHYSPHRSFVGRVSSIIGGIITGIIWPAIVVARVTKL